MLVSVIENTYTASIMRNLGFLLAYRHLTEVFQSLLDSDQSNGDFAKHAMARIRWDKRVDPYKSITFTLMKESDIFFATYKN